MDSAVLKQTAPPSPPEDLVKLLSSLEAEKLTNEGKVSQAITEYKKDRTFSEGEHKAVWAELDGFNFRLITGDEESPWGTAFAPLATRQRTNGAVELIPDLDHIDGPTVEYWKHRAGETPHPVMKARYCDLVWDLGPKILGSNKGLFPFAQVAASAYAQAVEENRYDHEVIAINYLKRALQLSLSINDKTLIEKTKVAMFSLFEKIADPSSIGNWVFLFDSLYDERKAEITENEQNRIIEGLEKMLAESSNPSAGENFNPFGAQAAAERLAHHYRRVNLLPEVHRVIKTQGESFAIAAQGAAPSVALSWLQDAQDAYRNAGLTAEADRIQVAAQKKAKEVEDNITEQTFTVRFSKEQVEAHRRLFTTGNLEVILFRLIHFHLPTLEQALEFNQTIDKNHPLLSRIAIKHMNDGQVTSWIGSYEDDPDGREVYALARNIDFKAPMLALAINHLRETHSVTAHTLLTFLYQSPVFTEPQRPLLKDALDAYLAGDHIKAIHVVMPQVETTVRNFLAQGERPTSRPRHRMPGCMQSLNLSEMLSDEWAKSTLGPDFTRYLQVFLNDPRGHNIRNRFAHGLLTYDEMNRQVSDRLLHILLTLSLLGREIPEPERDAPPKQ